MLGGTGSKIGEPMIPKVRSTALVSKEMERRLLAYGTLAVAGMAGAVAPAHAATVYTYAGQTLTGTDSLALDVDNDTNPDFFFALSNCSPCASLAIFTSPFSYGGNGVIARYLTYYPYGGPYGYPTFYPYATLLNFGEPIDSTGQWYDYGAYLWYGDTDDPSTQLGDFVNRELPGLLGLKFVDLNNDTFYGWARVRVYFDNTDPDAPLLTMDLIDYAYNNTPDRSITAGDPVPEPGSLGLLASGALGLAAWRKRKAK